MNSRVIDDKLLLIFGDSIYPKKSLEGLHHFAFTEQQKEKLEALNEIKLAGLTLADFNINPSFSVTKNGVLEKSTFVLENNINFVENSGGSFLAYMSVFDAEGVIKNNTLVALDHIENMYVTKDALYMYMTDWQSRTMWWDAIWSASQNTKIYAFDFKGDKIEYYGAGEMEGSLNNPFSLHATGDYLIGATNSFGADNKMISLKRENGDLNVVSTIEGIAEGERIQSVRFIGERAYVVTFLQVDPLFTVDISNPENLLLTGELKITGFSEYLHSIYDGVLLGVGRAGDDNGATNNGKISTFDVSDDHNPTEIESAEFSGEYNSSYMQFAVGYEHHSFTWANWLGMAGLIGHESGKEFLYLAKINEQGALLGFAKLDGNTKIDYWSGGSRSMFIGNTLYYIQSGKVIKYEIDSIEFVTKSSDLKKAKAN